MRKRIRILIIYQVFPALKKATENVPLDAMKKIEYKMGIGLPRGEKIVVKVGARQADIWLDHDEFAWRVKIDRDLPETTYPHLENGILSAQTLLREVT